MGKENGGRRSLRKKTARIIARWTLLLIVLISLAGQMASTYSLLRMRDDESLHMAEYAFSLMDREYIEKLYAETKQMMDHLPQEARENQTMESGTDVESICRKVNDRLYAQNDVGMFVTVYLAVLTISSGEVMYVNAGHEYPALRCDGKDFVTYKDVHGLALSIMGEMKYKSGTYRLKPGDTVFLYTDGVTEANAGDKILFGTDRLLAVLNRNPDDSPQGLTESVLAAVREFTGDRPQFDDTTMLALRYFGPGENHQGRT